VAFAHGDRGDHLHGGHVTDNVRDRVLGNADVEKILNLAD
jgi:hypothetical protein